LLYLDFSLDLWEHEIDFHLCKGDKMTIWSLVLIASMTTTHASGGVSIHSNQLHTPFYSLLECQAAGILLKSSEKEHQHDILGYNNPVSVKITYKCLEHVIPGVEDLLGNGG